MLNFLTQIQNQQQLQEAKKPNQLEFNGYKVFKAQWDFGNETTPYFSAPYRPEGISISLGDIPDPNDEKFSLPINIVMIPMTLYGYKEPSYNDNKSAFHQEGTNPYKQGLYADYAPNYFGFGVEYYSENMYQAYILEQGGKLQENQYIKFNLGEGEDHEFLVKFDVTMRGTNSDFRNYQILMNDVTVYDFKNQNVLTLTLDAEGIKNPSIRAMTKSEKTSIPLEAQELRRQVDEEYRKTFPANYKPIYESKNPIPEPDDGKGSINLDKLQQKVKEMTEGYKLEVKNESLYANASIQINKQNELG